MKNGQIVVKKDTKESKSVQKSDFFEHSNLI